MIILIVLHLFLLSRLQFTAWPEMFSFPYVINKGLLIYKDFHHVYQPLLTFVLVWVYRFFGYEILTLKTFTYLLIGLTDLALVANIKKITNKKAVWVFTLVSFVLLQPIFDGNMLWYDLAVTLPVLIVIYFVDVNLFLCGLFISISFLVKQQSILVIVPIFTYLLIKKNKNKEVFKFLLGLITPIIFLLIFLLKNNIFNDYLFWTFKFPLLYLPNIDGYVVAPNWKELLLMISMLAPLFVGIFTNRKQITSQFYLLLSILFFMTLSAFPRFSLFHLQPALAVYMLTVGYLFSLKNKYFILLLVPVIILWKGQLLNPNKENRFYSISELKMADEIKKISGNNKIYLLGPSSIEYVLSESIPSKPWIENYVWHFETPSLQEKVIDGWKIDPPMYIYWTKPTVGNWYDLGTYQPKKIVEYIKMNYIKVSEIDNVEVWKLQ